MIGTLMRTGCIPDGSKIWWDCRPHGFAYPTLEFRVYNHATRVDEAIAIATLSRPLCSRLWKLRHRNITFQPTARNCLGSRDFARRSRWH